MGDSEECIQSTKEKIEFGVGVETGFSLRWVGGMEGGWYVWLIGV